MDKLLLLLKGMAMGAANVIPGVSGGTIAFITGIYERLIGALKHLDLESVRLLFSGKWKALFIRIDFWFLFWIFLGVAISILSLAKVLEWALAEQEVLTMAFFFGLIVASTVSVAGMISGVTLSIALSFLVGCGVAIGVAFLPPASQNDATLYLILCGAVAVSSMVLPGLSGAYVLLLMGNYALVLGAVGELNLGVLFPIMVGVLVGLILFARLLDWLFKHYKQITISLLTGFVAGSLLIIWPWKNTLTGVFNGKEKAIGYEWLLPEMNTQFFLAIAIMIVGFGLVWWLDRVRPGVD